MGELGGGAGTARSHSHQWVMPPFVSDVVDLKGVLVCSPVRARAQPLSFSC